MKNFYTMDDIASLLLKKLYLIWDGKIKATIKVDDRLKLIRRPATVEEFEQACIKKSDKEYETITLKVSYYQTLEKLGDINIYVDRLSFKVANYYDIHSAPFFISYDEEWQEILFENHPNEFAEEYLAILEKRLKSIASRAQVKGVFKKHKCLSEGDLALYKSVKEKIDMVNGYLLMHSSLES